MSDTTGLFLWGKHILLVLSSLSLTAALTFYSGHNEKATAKKTHNKYQIWTHTADLGGISRKKIVLGLQGKVFTAGGLEGWLL